MKCSKAQQLIDWAAGRGGPDALPSKKANAVAQHVRKCEGCQSFIERRKQEMANRLGAVQTPTEQHDDQIAGRIGAVLDQITAFARDLEQEMHQGEPCLGCRGKIVLAVGRSLGLAVPLLVPLPQEQTDG